MGGFRYSGGQVSEVIFQGQQKHQHNKEKESGPITVQIVSKKRKAKKPIYWKLLTRTTFMSETIKISTMINKQGHLIGLGTNSWGEKKKRDERQANEKHHRKLKKPGGNRNQGGVKSIFGKTDGEEGAPTKKRNEQTSDESERWIIQAQPA